MKAFLKLLKVEGRLMLRSIDIIFFGICMPVGILLLIGMIGGKGEGSTMIQSSFAALSTVGICATAFMGIPLTITTYRERKILKHFFTTPVSPVMLLLVQVTMNVLVCFLSAILVYLAAKIFFGYQMLGSMLQFLGAYLLVMLSMFSLGMMIASVCPTTKESNVLCSVVYFPMLFLSGATIPFEIFPKFLRNIASVLPLSQGIQLLKSCSTNEVYGNVAIAILVMIASIVIGVVVSAKTFRWEA